MLETSLPGVLDVGDVRSGSAKHVASAVGEGAMAIHFIHRTLAELWRRSRSRDRFGKRLKPDIVGYRFFLKSRNFVPKTRVRIPSPAGAAFLRVSWLQRKIVCPRQSTVL